MTRKKVILVGPPFSGHLHPLLGIGKGLHDIADVQVISTPVGVKAAIRSGLNSQAVMVERESCIWAIAEPGVNVRNHPIRLWRQLKSNVGLMVQMKHELDGLFAVLKPDLVIADFTVPAAGLAAASLGIPWWTTLPSPCVFETPDGPPAYFGGQTPARSRCQHSKHTVMRVVTRQFKRCMWLLFRQSFRNIGVSGVYRKDGSEAIYSPDRILGFGVREIEFNRTYPTHFEFTGPILFTPPYEGPKPVFFQDGRPHVLITLGTHLPHEKLILLKTLQSIAKRQPRIIFHFTHGKDDGTVHKQLENFQELSFVSYSDDLPRYDLIVHHAGAGILNHCLQHGKPSVVYPLDFDQFDNAARLTACNLALLVRNRYGLEEAILCGLQDGKLKLNCQTMSHIFKKYTGVQRIVEMIKNAC